MNKSGCVIVLKNVCFIVLKLWKKTISFLLSNRSYILRCWQRVSVVSSLLLFTCSTITPVYLWGRIWETQ